MNFLLTTSTLPETNGSWHLKMVEHGVCLFSGAISVSFRECNQYSWKGILTFAPFMHHSSQRDSFRFDSAGDHFVPGTHLMRPGIAPGMVKSMACTSLGESSSVPATGLSKDP